jgi:hypothetical protein
LKNSTVSGSGAVRCGSSGCSLHCGQSIHQQAVERLLFLRSSFTYRPDNRQFVSSRMAGRNALSQQTEIILKNNGATHTRV